ncbi:MAG: hypothetical protein J6B23_06015 [Clostridia bacterium]|nr:hypothetical protein [Clostridia bacterium]
MIDFLIVYEIEQRELENVTLVGAELMKRGYSVCFEKFPFINKNTLRKKYENNVMVVLTHSMYNDTVLYNLVYAIAGKVNKIVNFQWEQIGSVADEEKLESYRYPKQTAKKIVHLCWGERISDILVKCGMDKKLTPVTGPIHMDFLREEFSGYYMSREELFKKYNIPADKKVMLFVSSFSYTSLTPAHIEILKRSLPEERIYSFQDISIRSQKAILEWIETYIQKNKDVVFIYRPHPVEYGNALLTETESRNPNLYVIKDYSVKQWIKTSDVIFNWFSTSMAEIHYSGKVGYVLRPVELPRDNDVAIMQDCRFLTTYEEFEAAADGTLDYEQSDKLIKEYYSVTEKPAYARCADFLETVISTNEYDYEWSNDILNLFGKKLRKQKLHDICLKFVLPFKITYNHIKKSLKLPYEEVKINFYKKRKLNKENTIKHESEKLAIMKKYI